MKYGLSQDSKKIIKFQENSLEIKKQNQLAMFIILGRQFYDNFKSIFGNGSQEIKFYSHSYFVPVDKLNLALILYHFSIEFLLKALLSIKEGGLDSKDENHDLWYLLNRVLQNYDEENFSELHKLYKVSEYALLIQELGNNSIKIRYGECCISIKHNYKKGWKNKKPYEELGEALDYIYHVLNDAMN